MDSALLENKMDVIGFKTLCKEALTGQQNTLHTDDIKIISSKITDIEIIDGIIRNITGCSIKYFELTNQNPLYLNATLGDDLKFIDDKVEIIAKGKILTELKELRERKIKELRQDYNVIFE